MFAPPLAPLQQKWSRLLGFILTIAFVVSTSKCLLLSSFASSGALRRTATAAHSTFAKHSFQEFKTVLGTTSKAVINRQSEPYHAASDLDEHICDIQSKRYLRNGDLEGPQGDVTNIPTVTKCCTTCSNTPECWGFVYNSEQKRCLLKANKASSENARPALTSGFVLSRNRKIIRSTWENPDPQPLPEPGLKMKPCVRKNGILYRSQSREDQALFEKFYQNPLKCSGIFVEIGALDGLKFSNSFFFEHALGWRSVLLEANPQNFKALKKNRPSAINIHTAVCSGTEILFQGNGAVGGALSTMSYQHKDRFIDLQQDKVISVQCKSFSDIFLKHGIKHIDIFVLDVEGAEYEALTTMDWAVRVDVWVIELDGEDPTKDANVRALLKENRYVQADWDIRSWCIHGKDCTRNEVFLDLNFV